MKNLTSLAVTCAPIAQRIGVTGLALTFLVGCSNTVGPKLVDHSFADYNRAFADVLREELLMNVVRRRYFETPQFIAFGSISTSRENRTTLDVGAGLNDNLAIDGITGNAGAELSDFPTYTITPQQGPEMAKRLHQQLPISVYSELANAGYPADLIYTLVAQDVNGVRGVDVGTGATFRNGAPEYMRMLNAMRSLQAGNQLVVTDVVWEEPHFQHAFAPEKLTPMEILEASKGGSTFESVDGGKSFFVSKKQMIPALWVTPASRTSPPGRELIGLMNLDANPTKRMWPLRNIKVVEGQELTTQAETSRQYVDVRNRSFYGVLNLLSQGVQLADNAGSDAVALAKEYEAACAAGHAPAISKMFFVHLSNKKPVNASVMTKYRGYWYYIDQNDTSSKSVFNALYDIYNLQVSPISTDTGAPQLTLPAR